MREVIVTRRHAVFGSLLLALAGFLADCSPPVGSADIHYRIFYRGNGQDSGSAPVDSKWYSTGDNAVVLENSSALVNAFKVFDGWNTGSDGSGTSYLPGQPLLVRLNNVFLYAFWYVNGGVVTTFAGSGVAGPADGIGTAASFNSPESLASDQAGNLYVADMNGNSIRKITPSGVVSTLAGTGAAGSADGAASAATFLEPTAVAVDASGNVYVGDAGNNKVRMVSADGVVSTLAGNGAAGFADGAAASAMFWFNGVGVGVAVDGAGNVYVGDYYNNRIRKISGGVVSTLAGSATPGSADGTGASASFNGPSGIVVDSSGNIYVADYANHAVRKVAPGGLVTTLSGGFANPHSVGVDSAGNVYVADVGTNLIGKISGSAVTTLAGSGTPASVDGTGTSASFNVPAGVAVDRLGHVYVAEQNGNVIRLIQ